MDLTKLTELISKIKTLHKEIESIKSTLVNMQKLYSDVQVFLDLIKNL